ncbi:hypothetical protein AJ80_08148 [Polytolypa hystricis UAMH7299]|uniref:Uncharacterized protein n=1 Tax=Polytolypa hystricis (strain UAMH7299) TaxID=1447883 RepID=A0A2B7XCE6_POLH7|nr:hypothetical protein AJ80_08148 [Polytolypa hystricis UAMH7299]
MAVRRTPTRSTFGPTPLSKSSLRVPLIDSPAPSPGLPSNIPRHGKQPLHRWNRRRWRLLLWMIGVVAIILFALSLQKSEQSPDAVSYLSQDGQPFEILGGDIIPDVPAPILVTDGRGRSRWTVSIPPDREFPLPPSDYAQLCSKSMDIAKYLAEKKSGKSGHHHGHHGYYHEDPNFIDVPDAVSHGLLPSFHHSDPIQVVGGEEYATSSLEICKESLTFVLQTEDAGLGATLMALWMSYGLAKKEGRAFFVDDTNWAYGRYTTYFQPPPTPSCRPPPPFQRIPCPRHARHLLVSTATTSWMFGHNFNEKFEDAHKMGVHRQKPIYSLLRAGYEALFQLNGDDLVYYNRRVADLNKRIRDKGGIEVGIHIRHGDLHPLEFQYQKSYIPLEAYRIAAEDLIASFRSGNIRPHPESGGEPSMEIVASDDPDVYATSEMIGTEKAQSFISLASKTALDAATAAQGGDSRMMDGNIGWEGGFFRELFWSLGAPSSRIARGSPAPSKRELSNPPQNNDMESSSASSKSDLQHFRFHPAPDALYLRELVGRAYLLDLAVLGQSDAVVCGVSSSGCRLLAVMMGWEKAIEEEKWKNVDGTWGWKGIIW